MKIKILIVFVIMLSFICQAQTDTITKRNSSKQIFTPNNFYAFKDTKNNSILFSNYTFDLKKISSPFDLFHDSLYIREVFYNNLFSTENEMLFVYNNHFYYIKDPLEPYGGGLGSTLVFGSLNYLIHLFENK